MTYANKNPKQDVTGLPDTETPNVNDIQDLSTENSREILDDDPNPMNHYETTPHVSDTWHRNPNGKHSKESHNED